MSLLDNVFSSSGGPAEQLATTDVPVTVGEAAPPSIGQALVATSSTTAEWTSQTVTTGELQTTGDPVVVSGSAPGEAQDVLALTDATHAAWVPASAKYIRTTGADVDVQSTPGAEGSVLMLSSETLANWSPIDVTTLSGLLPDPQTPLPHAASHTPDSGDTLDVEGLHGLLYDPQTPLAHAATHAVGGSDPVVPTALATTGAAVNVGAAAPGVAGHVLGLTSPTNATWSAPATPSALKTTGADVNVAASAPGAVGNVLTLTDATHAIWSGPSVISIPYAASVTIDMSLGSSFAIAPLTGDITIGFSNVVAGKKSLIYLEQDTAGLHNVLFPAFASPRILRENAFAFFVTGTARSQTVLAAEAILTADGLRILISERYLGIPLSSWQRVAMSSDGVRAAIVSNNLLLPVYTTSNAGVTWTSNPGLQRINYTLGMSANGASLVTGISTTSNIQYSLDYGVTWAAASTSNSTWIATVVSGDGSRYFAAPSNGTIAYATAPGSTWTVSGSGSRTWTGLAVSSDGLRAAGCVSSGLIYTTADGGTTWTGQAGSGSKAWNAIAMSADGTKLAATVASLNVYTSVDAGVTWTVQAGAGTRSWSSVAISSDGTKMLAAVTQSNLYLSVDSGVTWSAISAPGTRFWTCVAMSNDATKMMATAQLYGGGIWVSTDSGATWSEK